MKTRLIKIITLMLVVSVLAAGDWSELTKIIASDRENYDYFGNSVDISGDYAIVGAYHEDYVDGEDWYDDAGAAYIYYWNGSSWAQQQKLVASDRDADDHFGYAVAISGDKAIIGAYEEDEDENGLNTKSRAGSAYIFHRSGSTWTQQQKIVASDRNNLDSFGKAVAIDGDYIIVGVENEDENASGGATLSSAGSAYIFYWNGSTWSEQQKIVASDRAASDFFGHAVSISGDKVVIGANAEDEDASGSNTLSGAGSAYVFQRSGSIWTQQQKIVASDRGASDNFAWSVGISGDYIVIGADKEDEDASGGNTLSSAGAAYVFYWNASTWMQQQKIVATDRTASDYYSSAVAISGDNLVVGTYAEDHDEDGDNGMGDAGSAYFYNRSGSTWSFQNKVVASDREAWDNFAWSVSIDGSNAILGSIYDSNEPAGLWSSGSAYIFSQNTETPTPIALAAFTAKTNNGKVELAWETTSETENSHFLVYRDGEVLAQIDGAGTTTETNSYSYLDTRAQSGLHSYAIADVTYGGVEELHPSIKVEIKADIGEVSFELNGAYPNPFNPSVAISYQLSANSRVKASIYNTNGTLIEELLDSNMPIGSHELLWNASDMPSGVYILQMVAEDIVNTQKLVLMK